MYTALPVRLANQPYQQRVYVCCLLTHCLVVKEPSLPAKAPSTTSEPWLRFCLEARMQRASDRSLGSDATPAKREGGSGTIAETDYRLSLFPAQAKEPSFADLENFPQELGS